MMFPLWTIVTLRRFSRKAYSMADWIRRMVPTLEMGFEADADLDGNV